MAYNPRLYKENSTSHIHDCIWTSPDHMYIILQWYQKFCLDMLLLLQHCPEDKNFLETMIVATIVMIVATITQIAKFGNITG